MKYEDTVLSRKWKLHKIWILRFCVYQRKKATIMYMCIDIWVYADMHINSRKKEWHGERSGMEKRTLEKKTPHFFTLYRYQQCFDFSQPMYVLFSMNSTIDVQSEKGRRGDENNVNAMLFCPPFHWMGSLTGSVCGSYTHPSTSRLVCERLTLCTDIYFSKSISGCFTPKLHLL